MRRWRSLKFQPVLTYHVQNLSGQKVRKWLDSERPWQTRSHSGAKREILIPAMSVPGCQCCPKWHSKVCKDNSKSIHWHIAILIPLGIATQTSSSPPSIGWTVRRWAAACRHCSMPKGPGFQKHIIDILFYSIQAYPKKNKGALIPPQTQGKRWAWWAPDSYWFTCISGPRQSPGTSTYISSICATVHSSKLTAPGLADDD